MRAINHALTGAIVGIAIGEPVAAIPAALVSHFVCDAIPHFALHIDSETEIKMKAYRPLLIFDTLLCLVLVLLLFAFKPAHWQLGAVCAFVAAAPDFLSINYYRAVLKGKKYTFRGLLKLAGTIQWFQRPIGWVVEIVWFVASLSVLTLLAVH